MISAKITLSLVVLAVASAMQAQGNVSDGPNTAQEAGGDIGDGLAVLCTERDGTAVPGAEVQVIERGTQISGTVVDADTSEPLERILVMTITPDAHELPGVRIAAGITSGTGRFQLLAPLGQVWLYFGTVPAGYSYPDPQIVRTLDLHPETRSLEDRRLTLKKGTPQIVERAKAAVRQAAGR